MHDVHACSTLDLLLHFSRHPTGWRFFLQIGKLNIEHSLFMFVRLWIRPKQKAPTGRNRQGLPSPLHPANENHRQHQHAGGGGATGTHLRGRLHGFLTGFRRVSTKRLDEYLAWFLWRRTYTQDRESIAVRQVNVTPCDNTVRDWAHVMPPYMDYWGVTA